MQGWLMLTKWQSTITKKTHDKRVVTCHKSTSDRMAEQLWCVEEIKNFNQVQQFAEESLWLAHVAGLWMHIVNCKKTSIKRTKRDRWWRMIVVYAQVVKNESKREWRHSYVSIAMGMKSLLNVHSTYDRVFFLSNDHRCMCCCHRWLLHHIYVNWINNDNIHPGPKLTSNDKDIHSSLMWRKKRWKTSL